MNNVNNFINLIESLNLSDINNIINIIKEKYNFPLNQNIKENSEKEILKDNYSVKLLDSGKNKISVIKFIKDLNSLGLKEAKDFVDSAPVIIKENITNSVMKDIKEKLENLGAKLEIY